MSKFNQNRNNSIATIIAILQSGRLARKKTLFMFCVCEQK